MDIKLKELHRTRFYGSKYKLLPELSEVFMSLDFSTCIDVFGGTGSVSFLLSKLGKSVVYNDAFMFNAACARAITMRQVDLPPREKIVELISSIRPRSGFITKNFADVFFLDRENRWLDGAASTIQNCQSKRERDVVFYLVAQASLMKRPFNLFHRANLNIRIADVKRSFGNAATWEKSFNDLVFKLIDEFYQVERPDTQVDIRSVAADQISLEADLLYLDPPYLKTRSVDCYVRKYHFLEGLYRYRDWPSLISHDYKSKTITEYEHISKMYDYEYFKKTISGLIHGFSGGNIVVSYVNNGHESYRYILDQLESAGFVVKVESFDYRHALSKSKVSEVTIIGVKNECL